MKSYIGIDWSEKHHNVCILNKAGASLNRFQVAHTLAGFQRLEQQLAQVNEVAADCLVGIETHHNTLVDFLGSRGYTLYILPPKQVKSNRGRHRALFVGHLGRSLGGVVGRLGDDDILRRLQPAQSSPVVRPPLQARAQQNRRGRSPSAR